MSKVSLVKSRDVFHEVYHTIFIETFPENELYPYGEFARLVEDGSTIVYILKAEDKIVAAAAIEPLSDECVLFSYLAVHKEYRAHGFGSQLFLAVIEDLKSNPETKLILGEVENPDIHGEGNEITGYTLPRLKFYAKHGAVGIDLPYFQSPITKGQPRVHGLILTAFHLSADIVDAENGLLLSSANLPALMKTLMLLEPEDEIDSTDLAGLGLFNEASAPEGVAYFPIMECR